LIGLPPVIGEMLAGFLLGPTFFGFLAPHAFSAFFTPAGIHWIGQLATLIVTSYCFIIGLEFDASHLQGRKTAMALVALVSAFLPAVLGYVVAGYLSSWLPAGAPTAFKLAVAICFAATAFPVLLRILEDSGLSTGALGNLSIGISAVLELLIWASLPIVLAFAKASNPAQAGTAILWVAGFLFISFTVIRRALGWLWARIPSECLASWLLLAFVGIASAWLTERLGIHANFGAFVGGFIVPRAVSFKLAKKIKIPCVTLLPVFFAATGLKTSLNLGSPGQILLLFGFTLLAYSAKAIGTCLAAKLTAGLDWNAALTIGHLMCSKGAIGFAIIETCRSTGLLDARGYSILAFVILANTVMSAWGVLLHRRWADRIALSTSPIHL